MKVTVVPYREGVHTGNILWNGRYPMRGGRFPKDHPCNDVPDPFVLGPYTTNGKEVVPQPKGTNNSGLDRFRSRGYWASCFPEGDGITYKPLNGQSDEQQIQDVRETFGWEVVLG